MQRKTKDADGVEHVHGYSPYTIRGTLVPLTRTLNTAVTGRGGPTGFSTSESELDRISTSDLDGE